MTRAARESLQNILAEEGVDEVLRAIAAHLRARAEQLRKAGQHDEATTQRMAAVSCEHVAQFAD